MVVVNVRLSLSLGNLKPVLSKVLEMNLLMKMVFVRSTKINSVLRLKKRSIAEGLKDCKKLNNLLWGILADIQREFQL